MKTGRATNLDELKAILGKLFTDTGTEQGRAFKPRPDDVIISPYSKCGTTWMQQIAHGLRTRGSMAFEEITQVVPWIEAAHDLGLDLDADQPASPRLYKSHLPWDLVPRGGRYICVLRDPGDALLSLYNFFEGWLLEPGAVDFEDFARNHYLGRRLRAGYWHHLVSWCQQRDNPDVLLLCFEHLKIDFDRQLQRIASFLDITLDKELCDIVKRQSSLEFMREHNSRFDDHFLRDRRYRALGVPQHSNTSKVGRGIAGAHRGQLSAELEQLMADRWSELVTSELGWENYEALLRSLETP